MIAQQPLKDKRSYGQNMNLLYRFFTFISFHAIIALLMGFMMERLRNTPLKVMVAGTLGVTALAGCSNGGAEVQPKDSSTVHFEGGQVAADTHIRTAPFRLEERADGSNNTCATVPEPLDLPAGTVFLTKGDANGPWIGVPSSEIDNKEVQQKCPATVWIARKYVEGQFDYGTLQPLADTEQ